MTFAQLAQTLVNQTSHAGGPLNLLIEAPLSVAFTADGNPTGRRIEKRVVRNNGKRKTQTRYWYVGAGASMLAAAQFLVWKLLEKPIRREVCLVEGFASFKKKGVKSSHVADIGRLRTVVQGCRGGHIVGEEELRREKNDVLQSAFLVMGHDLGIPPVAVVGL